MAKTKNINSAQIERRANQAQGFLNAGKDILRLWEDNGRYEEDTIASVVGSLAVLAGIAASDVICGLNLGYHNNSGNHDDAIDLLRRVSEEAADLLQKILDEKGQVNYSTAYTSLAKAQSLVENAQSMYRLMLKEYRENNS